MRPLFVRLSWLFVLIAALLGGTPVEAAPPPDDEAKVALVIGNSEYKASPLENPANDAKLMASTLRDLGFEVIEGINIPLRRGAGLGIIGTF